MFKKDFFIIILLTLIFSLLIFFIKFYFFSWIEKNIEEQYIDRTISVNLNSGKNEIEWNTIQNNINEEKQQVTPNISEQNNNKVEIDFVYIPKDFNESILSETTILQEIIWNSVFSKILTYLWIDLYKTKFETRWKMKNARIKLFWVLLMESPELVSVFIHELWHYIDIYTLNNINLTIKDPSYYFYDIAWDTTKTIKSSMTQQDFVSWYAMKNKYEDFAESFAYYILHNNDFQKKAEKSKVLEKKYTFFWKYLFKDNEFKSIDFWNDEKIKDYYRDITKISINLENFLQYF